MPEPFTDVKAEVDYWEKQFTMCDQMRKLYEEIWYMNLAFYFSKQWVVWQRSTTGNSRLVDPATPRNRVRLITNRVKPIVRDELTKLTKEEPQFYVMPNTTSPKDVAAARVGEDLAECVLRTTKFNRTRRQATFWATICGTSFIKTTCPGDNEDLDIDKVTAFHLWVSNLEDENLDTQPYAIHGRGYNKDIVEEKYKVSLTSDMSNSGATLEQKLLNALGVKNRSGSDANMVFVKEIWIKPCGRYPNGGLIVIAGNRLVYRYGGEVESSDNEYPPGLQGEFPFDKINHTASGRFYGVSTIEDIVPLQKEYNKTRSQIIESKNRMSKPQMTYTKGAVDVTKITSEVGQYIPVNAGYDAPKPITIEPLPEYVMQEPDRIIQDMDEIAGRSDIDRGSVPTGIEAATAISYLSEKNDSKIYNTVAYISEAIEGVGRKVLSLVSQFWKMDKIIQVVSKANAYEASVFMINGLNNNFDLRIEAGSMAPKSKAAQQAFIVDLMDKGILPPDKGLRYLQMNETNRLYDELQASAKQAQRENFRMSQGIPVTINDYDEDPVHIYEHELIMRGEEFESYDPEIKKLFEDHLAETKQRVVDTNVGPGNSNTPVPTGESAGAGTAA